VQRKAFAYTLREDHPALFMEMRLGKTLVTIRRCLLYKPLTPSIGLRILIIAPNSALPSWEIELKRERERDIVYLQGTRAKRLELLGSGHRWNLLNKEGWMVIPEIEDELWDAVVVDESTTIKNIRAGITRFFVYRFGNVPHRWALSGLPNPENDMEFWSQIAWVNGGHAFGSDNFYEWRQRWFAQPDYGYGWRPLPGVLDEIHEEVGERAFVMTREQAGMEVPKVYERRWLELPKKLRRTYDVAEKEFILQYGGKLHKRTFHRLVTSTWRRQICDGFVDGKMVWDGKIKETVSLLREQLARQSVVVWFAYNRGLRKAVRALRKAKIHTEVLTGKVQMQERRKVQRRFQKGRFRVLCAQIKCADRGVDLSRASAAIYFSNSPSCEERMQTEDRIANVDQDETLLYIDLVARNTVDSDMSYGLTGKKRRSQGSLNAAIIHGIRYRSNQCA
jgi:SNF2 family DNA or RNA helicase